MRRARVVLAAVGSWISFGVASAPVGEPILVRSYQVELRNRTQSNISPLVQDTASQTKSDRPEGDDRQWERQSQFDLKGLTHWAAWEGAAAGRLEWLQMPKGTCSLLVDGATATQQCASILKLLKEGVFYERQQAGGIGRIWVPPDAESTSRLAVRRILSLWQWSTPSPNPVLVPGPRNWEVTETDPNGRFEVAYRAAGGAPVPTGVTIFKRKKEFQPVAAAATADEPPLLTATYVPDGELRLLVDADGQAIQSITGEERQRIELAGHKVGVSTTLVHIAQSKSAAGPGSDELASRYAKFKAMSNNLSVAALFEPPSRAMLKEQLSRQKLGSRTWTDLRDALARLEAGGKGTKEAGEIYLQLKALINLQPHICTELTRYAHGKPRNSLGFKTVLGALTASANSDQVQLALVQWLALDAIDTDTAVQLIMALAQTGAPSQPAEAALRHLAWRPGNVNDDLSNSAMLGLGAMARSLWRGGQTERADRLVSDLVKLLDGLGTPEATHTLMLVLGNAALPGYLDRLLLEVESPSAQTRGDASYALRAYPPEAVGPRLARMAAADADSGVRAEALRTMLLMQAQESLQLPLLRAVTKEADAEVRIAYWRLLIQWFPKQPEVLQQVRQASETDPAERVRKSIKSLLEKLP